MRTLVFLLCAFAGSAFGQLTWENPEQTFNSKPQDQSVVAKYRFTNTGKQSLKIGSVKTSCGCTTAALTKTEYAPGESGEIEAKFVFAGRTGRQEKAITVSTSDTPQQPTILRLVVNIEEPVKIQPEVVLWRVGDQPEPKTIHVAVADDSPAKIVSVTSDNPSVKVQTTEVKPGKEYEVQVTPADVNQPGAATLMIRTNYPQNNPETRYAYARIR
jgi:Protein of unknown function (DUF1573)